MNFVRKGEKNILTSLFAASDDSSTDDDSDNDNDDDSDNVDSLPGVPLEDEPLVGELGVESTQGVITKRFSLDTNSHLGEIKVIQNKQRGIAYQLWPAATFLCDFLEQNECRVLDLLLSTSDQLKGGESKPQPSNVMDINVLELGAGVGLCGLFVAKLWGPLQKHSSLRARQVVLTDLPQVIDALNDNITLNYTNKEMEKETVTEAYDGGGGREREQECAQDMCTVISAPLSWGCESEALPSLSHLDSALPTLVLAADCVYWECLFSPLISTLHALCSKGCVVMMCHTKRWKKDNKFFAMCKRKMDVEVIHEIVEKRVDEQTRQLRRIVTRIYTMKLKR